MKLDVPSMFAPLFRLLMQWSDMPDARALSPANRVELITLRWAQLHEPLTDLYLRTSDYLFGPDPARFQCLNGLQPCEILEENQLLVSTTEEVVDYVTLVVAAFDQMAGQPAVKLFQNQGYGRGGSVARIDVGWGPIEQARTAKLTRFEWYSWFNEQAGRLIAKYTRDCFFVKGSRARRFFATHLAAPLQSLLPYNPHLYKVVLGARSLTPQFAYVPVPQLVEAARSYSAAWYELNGTRLTSMDIDPKQFKRMPLKPEAWMLSHLEPNASPERIDQLARVWCVLLGHGSLELNARGSPSCTCLKCYAPKFESYNFIHYLNTVEAEYTKRFRTVKYKPGQPRNPFIKTEPRSDDNDYFTGQNLILEACIHRAEVHEIPF